MPAILKLRKAGCEDAQVGASDGHLPEGPGSDPAFGVGFYPAEVSVYVLGAVLTPRCNTRVSLELRRDPQEFADRIRNPGDHPGVVRDPLGMVHRGWPTERVHMLLEVGARDLHPEVHSPCRRQRGGKEQAQCECQLHVQPPLCRRPVSPQFSPQHVGRF